MQKLNPDIKITYSNCYVLGAPEDNLESIFSCNAKLGRTYSYGGGVGIDISKLAPAGAKVRNAAKESSGAVSFMDLFSMTTGLISQNGRRGALMISMACDHPDIEAFIDVKKDLEKVTKANISVRMTDEFMEAAKNNESFILSFTRKETGETIEKVVSARDVLMKLAYNNWDMGEPGILFWDRISKWNLLSEYENFEYAGTNPCAEEPLPAGGSCLLGSVNLSEYVSPSGKFMFDEFASDVYEITVAMNNVLDEGLELHPLQEQRDCVREWRQIGIGVMGVADMLIKMGIRYGSGGATAICDKIAEELLNSAMLSSCMLAKQNGKSFPMFDYEWLSSSPFYRDNVRPDVDRLIREYGLYNSQLLTIAPTGTLSTMLGISGGIEPIFAYSYNRKTESLHGKDKVYDQSPTIVKEYMQKHDLNDFDLLPEYFVTAKDLDYEQRVSMQSVWQDHIDASISSTVNLPYDATPEDVYNIYMKAYEMGLKGITVFRDGCRRASILTTSPKVEESKLETISENRFNSIVPVSRKTMGITHGNTYCKKCACGTMYITINRDEGGNIVETFVNTDKGGICKANIAAVNRLVSLSLRSGVKVDEIVDQIKGIDCPACRISKKNGNHIDGMSCADIIARTIHEFADANIPIAPVTVQFDDKVQSEPHRAEACPECGVAIVHDGGCIRCPECGWSKCG